MTYLDTATAVAVSGLAAGTLSRKVREGKLTRIYDPLDKRRALWSEAQIRALAPSPNAPEVRDDNRADLATMKFLEVAAAYQEGDREKAGRIIDNTPAALVAPLIEFAVVLAFTAIEDEVDATTDTTAGVEDEAVTSESIG